MESRGRSRVRGPKRKYPGASRSYSGPRGMSVSRSRSLSRYRVGLVRRRALAIANARTAGFLGFEKKFFDTAVALVSLTAPTDATGGEIDPTALPGAVACLNAMAQGDGEQNRDGKKVVLKSVQVKGMAQISGGELAAGPGKPVQVFVALVLDTQTNGAQLNSEDVFKNLSGNAEANVALTRNLLFSNRFRVLKSEILDLDLPALSHFAVDSFSTNGKAACFDWFVPLDLNVNFGSGTTAVIANIVDNSLHMIAYCTNTTGTPQITYNARVRFMG